MISESKHMAAVATGIHLIGYDW